MALKKNPTRRLARALVRILASLAVLLGILSIPWRGVRPALPPVVSGVAHGEGPLQAGVAVRSIDLGPEPTIAGFPRWRWRAEGLRTRPDGTKETITARALVLTEPGCTVALVSAELLLVPGALTEAVRSRVAGFGVDALVLAATHTHAGPGGWWDSLPGEIGATGPYDRATFERVADAVAGAVLDALATRAPATVAVARGKAVGLAYNRAGGEVDGRLLSVRLARPDGTPVAELVSFPAHPTLLGKQNRQLSGDWVGRLLAASPAGPRLFFQGVGGDQSARPPAGDLEPVEAEGRAVGAAVEKLAATTPVDTPTLSVGSATVPLPPLAPGAVPRLLRPAVATVLGGVFPASATATALRLGPALLLFAPVEPVEAVGRRWRELVGPDAEVLTLAGDYLGYVETAPRFEAGVGEAKRSYFGPELAARLEAAVGAAAGAVTPVTPAAGATAPVARPAGSSGER